ncbi:MAG: SusC/RagA family TonB-linked outer membrane protein [Bacteroidaceae bacterium]|nr:SusC/RagA family TonB-linked outer membrane protein [Bacteroidaceae bacterium]
MMKKRKITMYMRQFMQLLVALTVFMPSALNASATNAVAYEANDSVKVESKAVATVETRTITGTVYDAITNAPMPGVRVQATGHEKITTMTNAEGQYTLAIPSYVTLLSFSTPEYLLIQRPVYNDDIINVRLYSDGFSDNYVADIKAVEHNGFEKEISPSSTIDSDIQKNLGADIRSITRSGALAVGNAMFVRGINSLNAKTQPLVVVDGLIWDMQEGSSYLHTGIFNNILSAIDVEDIDEVKIMKNGTALYGSRAANGVLIINTKRGRSMATRIAVNAYGGITLAPKTMNVMGADDYRIYANDLVGSIANIPANTNFPFLRNDKDYVLYNKFHNDTDWEDYTYTEALSQNYKLNVEGGDDIAMYNFSFGYTTADSPLEANNMERMNVRLNSDISLAENFDTRVDISFSRVARELLDDGIREDQSKLPISSLGYLAKIKSPFLSPYRFSDLGVISKNYDAADNFAYSPARTAGVTYPNNSLYNPMIILKNGAGAYKNEMEYTNMAITVAPELKLGEFTITETFNYSLYRVNEVYYLPYADPSGATGYDFYSVSAGKRISNYAASLFSREAVITSDTRVAWDKRFGAHELDVYGGFRYTNFEYDTNSIGGANTGNDQNFGVSGSLDDLSTSGEDNMWTNLAWYLSADYSYLTKYFLQATASLETSSRFGKNADGALKIGGVAWGFFPSVQAAWLLSSEKWFKFKPINMLKLRVGYDAVGNDAIDFYAARSYLQTANFFNKTLGLELGNVENDGVKWETTHRINLGADMMLFDNRLGLSFDVYKSKTTDLLVQKKYAFVTGMDTYWSNGGELENVGFEASANYKVANSKNFQWEVGASVGHYKSEVTALDEALNPVAVYGGEVKTMVGQPVAVFWGYKTDGVIASAEEAAALGLYKKEGTNIHKFEAGDIKFVDINPGENPGLIDENDKTIIGDPNPDFYGNIYSSMKMKNWKLDVVCNYSVGNDIYNYYRQQLESGSSFNNQTTALVNRWTVDGQQTSTPKVVFGDPMGNSRFSDRWIEDGSYLRIKTIKLSYDVPVSYSWLQGLTLWCAAENVYTFTKYDGNDPETSVNNSILYQGIDAGLLPQSRSFHFGVKLNL